MDNRTFVRRCIYVAATVVGMFIVLALLWHIADIMGVVSAVASKLIHYISPLIYGFVIAYILFIPLSKFEETLKKNEKLAAVKPHRLRLFTVLTTYIGVIALIVIIISSIYLMIGGQLSQNTDFNQIVQYIINYFSDFSFGNIDIKANQSLSQIISSVQSWMEKYLISNMSGITSMVTGIGSKVIIVVVGIIISIYLMMDYENLVEKISDGYRGTLGRFTLGAKLYKAISIFNATFKQFLRGQLLEACLVAVLATIALWIVGVDYFGIIGVISGICNLIPFVGPWIGAIVAAVVSLLGGGYMTAVWAVVAMIIVQQIDNHLLAPKIVGDSVGLHPVITMIVLLVGADVGGIAGMLLAVPVAATVKNIYTYSVQRREADAGAVNINVDAEDAESENEANTDLGTDN